MDNKGNHRLVFIQQKLEKLDNFSQRQLVALRGAFSALIEEKLQEDKKTQR